jgi:hypothetical protein
MKADTMPSASNIISTYHLSDVSLVDDILCTHSLPLPVLAAQEPPTNISNEPIQETGERQTQTDCQAQEDAVENLLSPARHDPRLF